MLAHPKDALIYALRTSKLMLHRFVDDLKPEEFEAQPIDGLNSIAWILGHLTLTDRRILGALGGELPELPAGFEEKFTTTRTKAARQTGYGDPRELVQLFDLHRDRLIEATRAADEAKFNEATAVPSPLFADKGEAIAFMGLHTTMHAGQMSAIRRALGYPPIV